MGKTIVIEEQTYRRLSSTLEEIMHFKKRNVSLDDVINELIDIYQENSWNHFGAGAGGG
jgi:predicted CopG family antitoxin